MNPNIALSIQRPRFDPGEGQRNALAVRNAQMQEAANAMQLQSGMEDMAIRQAQRNALAGVDFSTPEGVRKGATAAAQAGDFDTFKALSEEYRKADEAGRKEILDQSEIFANISPLLMDESTYGIGITQLAEVAPQYAQMFPPQYDPNVQPLIERMALGTKAWREAQDRERTLAQGAVGKTVPYPEPVARQRSAEATARGTNVNVLPGEKKSQELDAKYYSELYQNLQGKARESEQRAMDYKLIDRLIGDAYSGSNADKVQSAKKLGRMLGLDLGDVSGPEAAAMVSNQLALQLRSPEGGAGMPGAMSDKDREFLIQMVPGLGTTKEGRQLMSEVQKRIAKRNQEVAKFARDYRLKNRHLDINFEQALADKFGDTDLFADLEGKVPEVESGEGFQEGQVYVDAQGNRAIYQNGEWVEQ